MQMLANSVEAGRPMPSAISTLARHHFDRHIRQKLLLARNEVEHGIDAWKSLVDARLISPQEMNAITQARSTQSRAWTLRELARTKLRRVAGRSGGRAQFVQPAFTLIFAAAVLLVAGAMFGYLANMIHSLAGVV